MHSAYARVDLLPALPEQLPLIRRYLEQLATDEGVPQARGSDAFLMQTLFGRPPVAVAHLVQAQLVGEVAASFCGLAVHSWKWGTFSGVLDMYVHALVIAPSHRGQGLGKAVIAALFDIACAQGASRLELLTTAGNEAAAAFYDQQGLLEAKHMVVRRRACAGSPGRA
ncbi:hypothetical protein DBR42_12475 [Pelomonas sp. HMWF004]|nr:hypothetical protein DBR42_12475 [Pelomonas sp. HMWF004]